jgi:hypothetical protein
MPSQAELEAGLPAPAYVPRETSLAPVVLAPGIAIVPLLQLQTDLEPFEANLEDIEGQIERAVIESQDAYQGGSDILSAIQTQLNKLEAKRVEVKKPADDFGTMVQKLVKPYKDRLDDAKKRLNAKMLVWYNAEEKRKKDAQEAIRKQQQEEADRLAAKAREQGQESTAAAIESMVAAAPTAPAPRVGVANYAGKTHAKRAYWNGAAHDTMEILRQIVAGNLPSHIVEFSKSGLNTIAQERIKKLPEAEQIDHVYMGIKITKDEKLV